MQKDEMITRLKRIIAVAPKDMHSVDIFIYSMSTNNLSYSVSPLLGNILSIILI